MYNSDYAALIVLSTASNVPNICNVSDAESGVPSGPLMGIFVNSLWICQRNARPRNFVHW